MKAESKPDVPKSALTAEVKLEIREVVEDRLKNLPGATHQIIEEIVAKRVASVERTYRLAALAVAGLLTIVGFAFYSHTSKMAMEKVTEVLTNSVAFKQTEDIKALRIEAKIAADDIHALRIKETNEVSRIVRYNELGQLILATPGGCVYLRDKDGNNSGATVCAGTNGFEIMYFGPFSYFQADRGIRSTIAQ